MKSSAREPWTGLHPRDLADLLPPLPCPWWICGGWAIDLWLDRSTREHADTDVGCLRDDVPALRGALERWELYLAKDGQLQRLRSGQSVPGDVNSLWCRRAGAASWDVQVMIEEADSSDWLFRRDARILRPLGSLTWRAGSLQVVCAEIQLLYKAKSVRPRDQADFNQCVPALDATTREWLATALEIAHPGHAWVAPLRAASAV